MRAVLDTNVLVSGILWQGAPHSLIGLVASGSLTLVTSPLLLAELDETLSKPKLASLLDQSQAAPERVLSDVQRLAELVDPPPFPEPVCRDPDDDHVLACAVAAGVTLIVTGDRDLLALHPWRGIAILAPSAALQLFEATQAT